MGLWNIEKEVPSRRICYHSWSKDFESLNSLRKRDVSSAFLDKMHLLQQVILQKSVLFLWAM